MSHIKVLMRRPGAVSSVQPAAGNHIVSSLGALGNRLSDAAASAFATRKSADGGPLSFISKVCEFIARNGPDIDLSFIVNALAGLKTPILITLGVAAVAGLVYLAWKLYKHFTAGGAASATKTIMEDLQSIAPDLFGVPGMPEAIADQVSAAVQAGPTEMVREVAEIKADVMQKQHKIDPGRAGSGINYFGERHRGAGMIAC